MKYLSDREETISNFNANYANELAELERDINKTMQLYEILLKKKPVVTLGSKFEYIILILRSIDYVISAISLARQQAIVEASVIIRLSIETSSTAFHIFNEEKEFENYKRNKYQSTRGITYASKRINGVGELWGALSNVMAHPNTHHGITTRLVEDKYFIEEANITIGAKQLNKHKDEKTIILLRIAANIVFRFFELIVSKSAKYKGVNVLYLAEYDLLMFGVSTENTIYKLMEEFKKTET